jgi:exodeoxyribonuclease-3
MRLVTWNCSKGAYSKKVPQLDRFVADVAVIQECAKPEVESERCLWFGDNSKQGIAVLARAPYRVLPLPVIDAVPKFVIPIAVSGPVNFTLFAVWSKKNKRYPYIQAVVKAVEMYREVFAGSPCVLMGDFNSNIIWDDEHPTELNHSALIRNMDSLGLASAYHGFFQEIPGSETLPTYYHLWNMGAPFHIDYCFMPSAWAKRLGQVEVGCYEEWKGLSDHRPMLVDVAMEE